MENKEILDIIYETSKNTAPVVLQLGSVVNNTVNHDIILIKEAPSAVISKLIREGCSISIYEDGAHVYSL